MDITWRDFSGEGEGRNGEKVQGIRSITGRHKIDKRRLRIVQEIEKPKNLYVQPRTCSKWGGNAERQGPTSKITVSSKAII